MKKTSFLGARRAVIIALGLMAMNFVAVLLGGFDEPLVAALYWTVISFLLLVGSRWAGFLLTLIMYAAMTALSIFQGLFMGLGYIVYMAMGAALYMTVLTANLQRSPLWGVIAGGIVRLAYMYLVFALLLPRINPDDVIQPTLLTAMYGWPLWVGSIVGGGATLPILFRFHLIESAGLGEEGTS